MEKLEVTHIAPLERSLDKWKDLLKEANELNEGLQQSLSHDYFSEKADLLLEEMEDSCPMCFHFARIQKKKNPNKNVLRPCQVCIVQDDCTILLEEITQIRTMLYEKPEISLEEIYHQILQRIQISINQLKGHLANQRGEGRESEKNEKRSI